MYQLSLPTTTFFLKLSLLTKFFDFLKCSQKEEKETIRIKMSESIKGQFRVLRSLTFAEAREMVKRPSAKHEVLTFLRVFANVKD